MIPGELKMSERAHVRSCAIAECALYLLAQADLFEDASQRLGLAGQLADVGPSMARHYRDAAASLEVLRRG